jgi:glycosyltransferase involved in cell wall biosynthesis
VTVAIPVLDGERYLDEVLAAVRAQRLDKEVELLIVDSGSSDRSLEIARDHDAVVHQIERHEFSHGGTRNRMMAMARGDHVAFLTQDATPSHDGWLAALLEGFEQADDVAAVFGPHDPRPDASHMIKAEMERHFASWGNGGRDIDVQRLDRSPAGLAAYRDFPGQLTFLSDVNCAVARWAWEHVPYREVHYAEDQLLGRELIEAGFAKVFHPRARVLHSHDYPPGSFFRRYFDEFRSLREVLGYRQAWGPSRTAADVRGLVAADARWLRSHGIRGRAAARPLAVSARHHSLRMAGAILGSHANRLPPMVRGALSLQGRRDFHPYEVPGSLLDAGDSFDPDWQWNFVRKGYPRRALALEPGSARPRGPLTAAWVVPTWGVGSGGHTTIFRLVRQLEQRGHSCVIHVFDPEGTEPRPGGSLREEIREHFLDIDAPVLRGLDSFAGADVGIATEWRTAFPVRDLLGCREKVYLVQDDEPQFYATSAQSIWAEESYRMGFRCVAYTPWMADILRERWGLEAHYFECGTDTETYTYAGPHGREPGLVAVYGRGETERRAVDLALAGLTTLFERRPGLRVNVFGSNLAVAAPLPVRDLGVLAPRELAALYRRASVGLVFSLTTHSLVAQEMMASGLPVVELEGDNVTSALGPAGELVELADRTPDAIAAAVERLLDDPAAASEMARRARAFVEERTWERAGDRLEAALFDFLARPRQTVAS